MKKILSAVDFSGGALHALNYAIKMAGHFDADVEMLWVDNSTEASSLVAISKDVRLEVKRQFEELIQDKKSSDKDVTLSYKLKKGKVYQEVCNLAKSGNADLIVAGSHGVSGFEQHWIGSNAFRIVSHSPVPVITVRSSYDIDRGLNRIVLPIDSTPETKLKVDYTCQLAKAFNAEILLLALFSTKLQTLQRKVESNADAACNEIERQGVVVSCNTKNSTNITKTTIAFAEENDADMISIMTEKDNSSSSILLGHYAQLMVNHSPVPVLSINANLR